MVTLGELLQANKDAIVRRWLDNVLASYPQDGAAAFRRQKDPFANPVGGSLREGTRGIVEALLGEMDAEAIRPHLQRIIKIRAVQQLTTSQAVGFVFQLKEAIRAELAEEAGDAQFAPEWAELDGRIDRIALAAFDIFVQCREQICELRVNEVKRRVSWILAKINQRGLDPELARIDLE
jgi:hypothetical protein